ncbi:MAG: amidohydrolase [Candidatus Heimdallarchaeota archaeon]|nr:MAG: amidohydrolase [Candidatus Heimdallarchaeota archaeon]
MVDLLIKNGVIITVNSKNEVISDGGVVIDADKIIDIGPMSKIQNYSFNNEIDAKGMVIIPGLINTHTHLAMTLFRGVADDVPGINWLPIIWSIEKNITAEHCYVGALLGCLEMITTGTTTFADQYWHMDRVVKAVNEAGMRANLAQGILELNEPDKGERELTESVAFAKKWNNSSNGRITCKLGPHSIYTCSPTLLQKTREAADEIDVGLHIHVAEAPNEPKMTKEKHGETSIEHLHNLGILKDDVLAAHCVFVNKADMKIMKQTNTSVAHCPTAMMKYGNEVAPIPELLEKEVMVGIGTDGCGSNNNLDMIEEMRTAAFLHKQNKREGTVLPAQQIIRMATILGAKSLGLENEIGSLEVGKKADIIMLDFKKPHLTPFHNCPSHIVYSAFGSDVDTVIIDGNVVMKNGQIITLDESKVLTLAQEAFEELLEIGGYSLSYEKNPKPGFKTNLTVKSFQTFLKLQQKLKGG